MLDISLIGINELREGFATFPAALNNALLSKSQLLADALAQKIRDEKLSGQVLVEKSGRLRDSIASNAQGDDSGASASVFVDGDVPYAAIQEYGGQTKAHVIEASRGKSLAFTFAGKQAFFTHVNHPGSNIPERSYLRSAFEESQEDIVEGMAEALQEIVNGE